KELVAQRPRLKLREIAERLDRTYGGVADKMHEFGLRILPEWTSEDRQVLIDAPGKDMSLLEVSVVLGRTYTNVAKMAEQMGVRFANGPLPKSGRRQAWKNPAAEGAIAVERVHAFAHASVVPATIDQVCDFLRAIGRLPREVEPGRWSMEGTTVYALDGFL